MNNEFNNNQTGENENNAYPVNSSNNSNESNNFDYTYSTGNFDSYHNSSQSYQQLNPAPYVAYQAQKAAEEKKPKKKRKVFGVLKLTAAAMAFGLIAGATFQGFYLLTQPSIENNNNSSIKIAEVSSTNSGDTIKPATTASGTIATDVSDVVEKAMPSIVAINSTANVTSYDFFGREISQEAQASGSGIIIGQNGDQILIVTNNHVISDAQSIQIVFVDNTTATATLKGADSNADLAVLSVNLSDLSADTAAAIKVATIGDSNKVQPGEMAIAIGNALGYGQSVTVGYISAVNREVTLSDTQSMTLLQTDAAINPGNSGGALLNAAGEVIGINSVKLVTEEVEGMGYAIPISTALPMINELINRQVVPAAEQGYLGIDASTAQNVTEEYAQRFNMPIGVYVNDVIKDSPAEAAGLIQGDIITGLDGMKIETIDDLKNALSYKKADQDISLTIQMKENGAYTEKTLNVTLGSRD